MKLNLGPKKDIINTSAQNSFNFTKYTSKHNSAQHHTRTIIYNIMLGQKYPRRCLKKRIHDNEGKKKNFTARSI